LMIGSTAVDYVCGWVMARGSSRGGEWGQVDPAGPRSRAQRTALFFSIASNLSLLGFFKYFNFGVDTVNAAAGAMGWEGVDTALRVALPLGISFYTFQSMSYSIDVFRGHARAIRNPIDFACYVSMFPQLVAGPIIRFAEVASQLREREHTLTKFSRGVAFVALGLSKKVLLANPCGKIADTVFNAGGASVLDAWYGLAAYSFQIYFDFSGYSDMAIGLGLMLGFVFPRNFDSPYHSRSITEFWRRWHISLSNWLRDYLYIPLGGNRLGPVRTYINLMLVMLLGGLWHGASWNFLVWGGIHGSLLAIERLRGGHGLFHRAPAFVQCAGTWMLVCFAWVFFRSPDLPSALNYLGNMVGLGLRPDGAALLGGLIYQPYYLAMMLVSVWVVWIGAPTWNYTRHLHPRRVALILLLFLLSIVMLTTQSFNPFIYFIF